MNNDADRDSIFSDAFITADNEATENTLRAVSISSLSMLTKLNNPLRYLFWGTATDAQVVLSEDLPYLLEFIWLHKAPLSEVRKLVINGDIMAIANAVLDFGEKLTLEQLKKYVEQLQADAEKVLLASATPLEQGGTGKNEHSHY